ncbi:MAG TPA: biopolymer transporter ExbD [Lacunisphaera sp.]
MARIFRRPRQLHPVAELNVTNMVDLGFTLLIIFMITTPLIQQEQTIPLNLPGESKKPQQKPDMDFQTVAIDQNGKVYVGSKQVTFTELGKALDEFAARSKPPVIRLRGDMTLQYQQIVRIMDELMKRNLTKISLDTESK